ncbi:hypothetical protein F3J37_01330 [Pantoea sp. Al-1710]|uniref:Uncharacterized protein n=1 Tax=Candidatus Pantoea communis TaxID=2608354 RepID=A0ABX0RN49_9GAMM|nr:hypothetical protein [Pantoea sp. Cy-640]NIG17319.1 hypothetical protein [Pantoea communis]
MKKSWFEHYPMNEVEANSLIRDYAKRGVTTEKHLTSDPRFFIVSAFLPVSKFVPRSNRAYINNLWN